MDSAERTLVNLVCELAHLRNVLRERRRHFATVQENLRARNLSGVVGYPLHALHYEPVVYAVLRRREPDLLDHPPVVHGEVELPRDKVVEAVNLIVAVNYLRGELRVTLGEGLYSVELHGARDYRHPDKRLLQREVDVPVEALCEYPF